MPEGRKATQSRVDPEPPRVEAESPTKAGPTLDQLAQYLATGRRAGQLPLFILGSGVSADTVPMLSEMAAWLHQSLTRVGETFDSTKEDVETATRLASELMTASSGFRRDQATQLFSILQSGTKPFVEIWVNFATWFVFGSSHSQRTRGEGPEHKGLLSAEPSKAHQAIAELVGRQQARVMSLNFDGLTHEALSGLDRGALMLHTDEDITQYFAGGAQLTSVPAVVKIRGDAFLARCTQPQCPNSRSQFVLSKRAVESLKAKRTLLCNACGNPGLELQLSFPGEQQKETASESTLWALRRAVGSRTSALITLGLSMDWDPHIADFLLDWTLERKVPLVDIRRSDPDSRSIFALRQADFLSVPLLTEFPESREAGLIGMRIEHMDEIAQLKAEPTRDDPIPYRKDGGDQHVARRKLKSPRYFSGALPEYRTHRSLVTPSDPNKVDASLGSNGEWDPPKGVGKWIEIHTSVATKLEAISQLGLQEIWLGGEPGQHDRWNHSVGTYSMGHLWMSVLRSTEAVPEEAIKLLKRGWATAYSLVGHALLLHDYGHLLFSHLTERMLQSINWVPKTALSQANSLEAVILQQRAEKQEVKASLETLASLAGVSVNTARAMLQDLIHGRFALPWLQALVNSPIDADKIDYVRFDTELVAEHFGHVSVGAVAREDWLNEFFHDQRVNSEGLLVLNGRSACAAVDLWKERLTLYDRVYLGPEMRVPERITSEILQQFIIRATMGNGFRNQSELGGIQSFLERADSGIHDPIPLKLDTAAEILERLTPMSGDAEEREFPVLEMMFDALMNESSIEQGYRDFLSGTWDSIIRPLRGDDGLLAVADRTIVRTPIRFPRSRFEQVTELLRPLMHIFRNDVLVDIAKLPRVLSPGARWRQGRRFPGTLEIDYGILVPDGDAQQWTPKSRATVPLGDHSVRNLEQEMARIVVIAPDANSPMARHAWDQILKRLTQSGIAAREG